MSEKVGAIYSLLQETQVQKTDYTVKTNNTSPQKTGTTLQSKDRDGILSIWTYKTSKCHCLIADKTNLKTSKSAVKLDEDGEHMHCGNPSSDRNVSSHLPSSELLGLPI